MLCFIMLFDNQMAVSLEETASSPNGLRTPVELFMDSESLQFMGNEIALVISNHRSDIEWLVGWILAQRSGCLGSALAVAKKSSKYLPAEKQGAHFYSVIVTKHEASAGIVCLVQ
ncbi:hypothetical protein AgCh_017299 [Apium graveolens]